MSYYVIQGAAEKKLYAKSENVKYEGKLKQDELTKKHLDKNYKETYLVNYFFFFFFVLRIFSHYPHLFLFRTLKKSYVWRK